MRTIETCILRIWIDTDDPQVLCGAVRTIAEDAEHSFTDEQTLLALLRSIGLAKLRLVATASSEMIADPAD